MKIEISRGDSYTAILSFTDTTSGAIIDITGYTVYFTVRPVSSIEGLTSVNNDSSAIIAKQITSHSNPTQGQTTLSLSSTETNLDPDVYAFDIQLKNGSNKTTVVVGRFTITSDVTRS